MWTDTIILGVNVCMQNPGDALKLELCTRRICKTVECSLNEPRETVCMNLLNTETQIKLRIP